MEKQPDKDGGRPRQEAPSNVDNTSSHILRDAAENLTHLQRRCVLEAVEAASAAFWERRAAELELARPVPGDFTGKASRADLSRRWRDLTEMAQACRARAELLRMGIEDPELEELLDRVIAC